MLNSFKEKEMSQKQNEKLSSTCALSILTDVAE